MDEIKTGALTRDKMARCLLASFLLVSSGLVFSAVAAQSLHLSQSQSSQGYQSFPASDNNAAVQEQGKKLSQRNDYQNDAQAAPPTSNIYSVNQQQQYKSSYAGQNQQFSQNSYSPPTNNEPQYQSNPQPVGQKNLSSSNFGSSPSNNGQNPQAPNAPVSNAGQNAPVSNNVPIAPAPNNGQSQSQSTYPSNFQPPQTQAMTANRVDYPVKPSQGFSGSMSPTSTQIQCELINSKMCHDSIDRSITHGIAVLAQNLSTSIAQAMPGYQEDGNIVFSPINVATALALVLVGSDGNTFKELSHVLGLAAGLNLRPEVRELMYQEFGRFLSQLEQRQSVAANRHSDLGNRVVALDGGNQVVFANGLFVQKEFCILERFDKIAKYFRSDVHSIDFIKNPQESKDKINSWFDTQTKGRIKNMLVQAPPADTRVLIASALYFNGEWETPFPSDVSGVRQFFVSMKMVNNTYVDAYPVNMMTNSLNTRYYADKDLNCKIVELPYKGRNVSMFLILPDAPGVPALRELERRLTPEHLLYMISNAKVLPSIVSMPRMKLSQTISLRSALEALGVHTLFDPWSANLTLISEEKSASSTGECPKLAGAAENAPSTMAPVPSTPVPAPGQASPAKSPVVGKFGGKQVPTNARNPPPAHTVPDHDRRKEMLLLRSGFDRLYAADILHKVDVEVTETGTVAAAGTATTISRDGSNQVVRLNRPFLFLIRDNPTELTLFYGSVVRPNPATAAEIEEAGPMATAVPPTRRPPLNTGHRQSWGTRV